MKTAATLLVVLLFAVLGLGQDRPTITAQPNTVFVGADGKFEAQPGHCPGAIQHLGAGKQFTRGL